METGDREGAVEERRVRSGYHSACYLCANFCVSEDNVSNFCYS